MEDFLKNRDSDSLQVKVTQSDLRAGIPFRTTSYVEINEIEKEEQSTGGAGDVYR